MIALLILLFILAIIYWGAGLFLPANIQKVLGVILGIIWIIKAMALLGYNVL